MPDEIFGDPTISQGSFISSKATIIGKNIIEEGVIVAPGVCLRADEGSPHRICKGTNIQDGVIIHGLLGKYVEVEGEKYSVYVGSHCSLAHRALIHGPTKIGKKTFVGFNAIIHNSSIGSHCHIGHGAIVEGVKIASRRYVPNGTVVDCQEKADKLPAVPESKSEFNKEVVDYNKKLVTMYKERRKMREKEKKLKVKRKKTKK